LGYFVYSWGFALACKEVVCILMAYETILTKKDTLQMELTA